MTAQRINQQRKADLAELMANGCPSFTEAALQMGISRHQVANAWSCIRRDLGRQAA